MRANEFLIEAKQASLDLFEMFTTKFLAPVTTYNEETGEFMVSKDSNGDTIYTDMPQDDITSLLQFYDERKIDNFDTFAYSASGSTGLVSGYVETNILPYQLFDGSGTIERIDWGS